MPGKGRPFEKGCTAGPGRPKGQTLRGAFKARLATPNPDRPKESRYEQWAREMIDEAITIDKRMEIIKFIEGATPLIKPSDEPLEDASAVDEHGNAIEP